MTTKLRALNSKQKQNKVKRITYSHTRIATCTYMVSLLYESFNQLCARDVRWRKRYILRTKLQSVHCIYVLRNLCITYDMGIYIDCIIGRLFFWTTLFICALNVVAHHSMFSSGTKAKLRERVKTNWFKGKFRLSKSRRDFSEEWEF